MNYKVWNKKDEINGIKADIVMDSHGIKENDEIFLLQDEYGNVCELQFANIIKSNYEMPINLTCEEVAQEYIRIKEEEKAQAEQDKVSMEQQQEEINALKLENEALKTELSITQDAVNELIFSSMNVE